MARGVGAVFAPREAQQEYLQPTSISFRSVLMVEAALVAIIVGALLILAYA